jgi:uncharacterized protein YegP (UPF0339 family)
MRQWIGFATLLVGLAVLAVPAMPLADAQDKKDLKKDAKKDAKKGDKKDAKDKEMGPGSIEIYKAKDGYRFRIKDAEGKSMAIASKGYAEKEDVAKVLDAIKATLNQAKPVDAKD